MKSVLALTIVAVILTPQSDVRPNIDPVGSWAFSGQSASGQPSAGRIVISGKPGAYTGSIVTSQGREVPLIEVMTSPTAIIVMGAAEQGAVVVRVERDGTGAFTGVWANVPKLGALTMHKIP